jgi:hypothetical protein
MMILLETFGGVALFIVLGLVFVWLFGKITIGLERPSRAERLDAHHHNAAYERDAVRQQLLKDIQHTPKHLRAPLWVQYDTLAANDAALDTTEIEAIANASTAIDDQIEYELEHDINPYVKPEKTVDPAIARKRAWRGF